jgi:hypothetical protein
LSRARRYLGRESGNVATLRDELVLALRCAPHPQQ